MFKITLVLFCIFLFSDIKFPTKGHIQYQYVSEGYEGKHDLSEIKEYKTGPVVTVYVGPIFTWYSGISK